jgi:gamma-D-glutamyl-L-lysine dipeptidyl-peptidase
VAAATAQRGEISVPVASIFKEPKPTSERVTQALLGEPVQIVEQRGSWSRVYVTRQYRLQEGYPGWVLTSALSLGPTAPGAGRTVCVAVARASVRKAPQALAPPLSGVFMATRLHTSGHEQGGWLQVQVPGSQELGWIAVSDLAAQGRQASATPHSGRDLVSTALQLRGTPYLWGGLSVLGVDCSGLTTLAYRVHGLELPRDADQQALVGDKVEEANLQAGDLLFFGKKPTDITHVAMYWDKGRMVEASSHGGVKVSTLASRRAIFQGARRVLGTQLVMPPPSP